LRATAEPPARSKRATAGLPAQSERHRH
jgi:hypothetical protein